MLLASIAVWWTHAATELFPDRGTTASVLPVVLKVLDFLDASLGHRPTGLQPACNVVDGPSTCRRAAMSAPPPAGTPMEEAL